MVLYYYYYDDISNRDISLKGLGFNIVLAVICRLLMWSSTLKVKWCSGMDILCFVETSRLD